MPSDDDKRLELDLGGRRAPLIARVNRRAKRLILKVDPAAGEIYVTAPSKRALPEAIAFARARADWIAGELDESLRARPFQPGQRVPLRGRAHHIAHAPSARRPVERREAPAPSLVVGGDAAHLNRRLADWLKREARKDLTAATERYCAMLERKRGPISIRDPRSRWGSCSSEGAMSFSWRLILAPPHILDYVAAHECVHLVYMHHGPAFWRQVKALGVDARAAEDWFAKHGASLFVYGGAQLRQAA